MQILQKGRTTVERTYWHNIHITQTLSPPKKTRSMSMQWRTKFTIPQSPGIKLWNINHYILHVRIMKSFSKHDYLKFLTSLWKLQQTEYLLHNISVRARQQVYQQGNSSSMHNRHCLLAVTRCNVGQSPCRLELHVGAEKSRIRHFIYSSLLAI